jgi:iron complex outermembrane receptor protein
MFDLSFAPGARWMGATAITAVLCATAAQAQPAHQADYMLPAQELAQSLREISLRSGTSVIAPSELVTGKQAPPLKGQYDARRAIEFLLEGSGLRVQLVGDALVISRAAGPAQGAGSSAPQPGDSETITVTGTRIRGTGSASPVTVTTRRELEQGGIGDLADFTRILPQNYTGGQNRGIAGGGEQGGQQNLNNSATLNLRGLGPDATLTLLDGHRLAYDALNQGIDISAIPLGAIERIEVVADGSSALYGSDAVGGAANIILRRDYDGLEATARIGGSTDGGNFQKQLSLVGGQRWSSGGFMLALDASRGTAIFAGQRDYTGTVHPSLTLTDPNRQLSGVLTAHQSLGPKLSLEVDGYVTDRKSRHQNPFSPTTDVRVSGIVSRPHVRSWALAPTLRADLGSWQASLSATGANSRTFLDAKNYTNGVPRHAHLLYQNSLKGAEATAEGPLFALPGGDARLAVGGGLRAISLHLRQQILTGGQFLTTREFTERRKVQFAYGELSLPLVRPELDLPLVDRLTLSAALRHERWSGIDSVTTPKVSVVYQPAPAVTVRAAWGKSFKIPTLLQVNQIQEGNLIPGFFFVPPPQPIGSPVLLLTGSAPGLKPERATTWSGTVEWKPPFISGLSLQATYFNIDYRGRIASPIPSPITALNNPLYDDLIIYNPSAAQVNALLATLPGGLINQTGAPFDPSGVGAIVDIAIRNTQRQHIRGVDLSADYKRDLGPSGTVLLTGVASYLESDQQLAPNQPVIQLAGTVFRPPHWRGRAGAAWEGERAGLSAFVNYVGRTKDNRFATVETIGSFVTLDLNASLRTGTNGGPFRNIELRLSALNLLDAEPDFVRNPFPSAAPYDATNQSPVGRFLGLSVRKSW